MRYCRRALFAVALLIPTASPAWGQPSVLSGYLQTVSLLSISGGFSESDLALYSRLRVAAEPEFESVSLTLAYELTATIPQPEDSYVTVARVSGVGADSNDWLDLHGVVTDGKQYNAQHRIDRLQFNWSLSDKVEDQSRPASDLLGNNPLPNSRRSLHPVPPGGSLSRI